MSKTTYSQEPEGTVKDTNKGKNLVGDHRVEQEDALGRTGSGSSASSEADARFKAEQNRKSTPARK